jgi:hypothetical protein
MQRRREEKALVLCDLCASARNVFLFGSGQNSEGEILASLGGPDGSDIVRLE